MPGHASAAACSVARICDVRTGAAVSAFTATTSSGETSTTAPVFVCTRIRGSTASRCPMTSVSGGTDPAGSR